MLNLHATSETFTLKPTDLLLRCDKHINGYTPKLQYLSFLQPALKVIFEPFVASVHVMNAILSIIDGYLKMEREKVVLMITPLKVDPTSTRSQHQCNACRQVGLQWNTKEISGNSPQDYCKT